jgi:uncharacterized protein YdbL (DUF1318 family)
MHASVPAPDRSIVPRPRRTAPAAARDLPAALPLPAALALPTALVALLLGACVTINVYFPAAAAEKAADRIIEQVYGGAGAPAQAPPAGDKRTNLAPGSAVAPAPRSAAMPAFAPESQGVLQAAAIRVLDFVIPAAHAQQPDLNVSTPAIRALVASMEARHATLVPHYQSGAVGIGDDGMIEIRDQNAIPLAERNNVRKLVADENADRGNLYAEIARANNNPDWVTDIRNTFARRWIDKAQAGWWVKDGGAWKQK